jgi:uncharacterized protein (TIGR00369 family)
MTEAPELSRLLGSAPFNDYYQFRLAGARDGECTIDVTFRADFERPGGVVAGPVFMAAADVAIWLAILSRTGVDQTWLTTDLQTAFLRAARREGFSCRARLLKLGQRQAYAVAECVRSDGTLLTHHTGTYARASGMEARPISP